METTFNRVFDTALDFGGKWLESQTIKDGPSVTVRQPGVGEWLRANWVAVAVTVAGGILAIWLAKKLLK